jgi:ABC-type uncharacterized transport system substrate-binding protein
MSKEKRNEFAFYDPALFVDTYFPTDEDRYQAIIDASLATI